MSTAQNLNSDFSTIQINEPQTILSPYKSTYQITSPMKIPAECESPKEIEIPEAQELGVTTELQDVPGDAPLMRLKGGFFIPVCLPCHCWLPCCWCGPWSMVLKSSLKGNLRRFCYSWFLWQDTWAMRYTSVFFYHKKLYVRKILMHWESFFLISSSWISVRSPGHPKFV